MIFVPLLIFTTLSLFPLNLIKIIKKICSGKEDSGFGWISLAVSVEACISCASKCASQCFLCSAWGQVRSELEHGDRSGFLGVWLLPLCFCSSLKTPCSSRGMSAKILHPLHWEPSQVKGIVVWPT